MNYFEFYNIPVSFKVDEGDLYTLGRIDVVGNTLFSKDDILKHFELKTGMAYDALELEDAYERLEELYGNKGFVTQRSNQSNVLTTLIFKEVPDFRTKTVQIVGRNEVFKRIDDGTPGQLQGAWLMSGRVKNGELQNRDTNRPRKTMKILSGTRF